MDHVIEEALHSHLRAFDVEVKISWPNQDFSAINGIEYLRPTVIPADTVQATLGEVGENRHSGLYQVDVFWPANQSSISPKQRGSQIANHFKAGTQLSREGLLIRILSPPTVGAGIQEPNWYRVPVTIPYTCDIQRS